MGFRELKVTQVRNSFVRGDGIQAGTLTLKFVNGSSDIVCRMGGKGQYYQDPVTASKDQSEKNIYSQVLFNYLMQLGLKCIILEYTDIVAIPAYSI